MGERVGGWEGVGRGGDRGAAGEMADIFLEGEGLRKSFGL